MEAKIYENSIFGTWDENQGVYVATLADSQKIVSADGDDWYVEILGGASPSPSFDDVSIHLEGGPRDGQIVA